MRRSVRKKHTSENFIQPKKAVGRRHPNDSIFESGVGNVAKQYAHGNIIKKPRNVEASNKEAIFHKIHIICSIILQTNICNVYLNYFITFICIQISHIF